MKKKYKILSIILLIIVAIGVGTYYFSHFPSKHDLTILNAMDHQIYITKVKIDSKTLLDKSIGLPDEQGVKRLILSFNAFNPKQLELTFYDTVNKAEYLFEKKLPYIDETSSLYRDDIVGYIFHYEIEGIDTLTSFCEPLYLYWD